MGAIKLRIFIPLILAVVVLLASFIAALRHDQNRRAELEIRRSAEELQKLLRVEQAQKTATMATAIQAILNDERMAKAFRERDREALLQRAGPLQKALSLQRQITHMYFHGPDRVNLLRVHHPEQHGDLINRFTLREAERTGEMASGIERGPIGTFVLRVVTPWRDHGELLGYLELGLEFEDIARELHGLIDVDFVVAVEKKLIDREHWDIALQDQGKEGSWDQFSEVVIIDKTMQVLPEPIVKLLSSERPPTAPTASVVSWNGRVAHLILLRLEDAGGKGFGELFVMRDVTGSFAQARQSIWLISFICLAVSAILLSLFYVFLGRIQTTLAEQTAELRAEMSERQRAAEELHESEARTRLLVKSSNIGLWDWNLITNEVFFSAEWKSQLGYTDAELPSRFEEWESRLHPEDREPTLTAVKDFLEGRRADYEVEFRLRHKDGSWRWFLTRANPTRDSTGQPVRIMGCHIDITERKRGEEALRESEERFSGAFEHAPIGVALVSPDGRWLKVNRVLCDLVGYSEAGLLARTFQDITHPEDLEIDLEYVRQMLAGEIRFYQMEKRYVHARGHLVTVLLDVSLVRAGQGQPIYFIAQIQDITERKLSEGALEKAHKELVEASRQAGMAEVAASVLHNVGNVLNSVNVSCSVISGSVRKSRIGSVAKTAALLREHGGDLAAFFTSNPTGLKLPDYLGKLATRLSEEQAEVLKELELLGQNIDHIKDIIAVQQSCANVGGVRETLPVTDLVEDALRMSAGAISLHRINVVRDYQEVPPVPMQKHQVLQILVNLLRNAKHALTASDRLDKQLVVRIGRNNGHVAVSVSDNGIGIAAENMTRIFAHGFTTKKDGHGFGLHSGVLAAQEMGGRLTVHSDGPGAGATFTLELPANLSGNNHELQPS